MKIRNLNVCLVLVAAFAVCNIGCYEHRRGPGIEIEVHDSGWHHDHDQDHGVQWNHDNKH